MFAYSPPTPFPPLTVSCLPPSAAISLPTATPTTYATQTHPLLPYPTAVKHYMHTHACTQAHTRTHMGARIILLPLQCFLCFPFCVGFCIYFLYGLRHSSLNPYNDHTLLGSKRDQLLGASSASRRAARDVDSSSLSSSGTDSQETAH